MSETAPVASVRHHHHYGFVTVIAVLAIGTIAYIAWSQGMFKSREKVAMVAWNQSTFWQPMKAGAEDAAREFGVDLTFITPSPDEAGQTRILQDLVANHTDGIAICPTNPAGQQSALNDAAGKTVLITFDSDAPESKRQAFIGSNDYAAGSVAADMVREVLPDGGAVLVSVGGVDKTNGRDRRQGLIDNLLDRNNPASKRQYDELNAPLKNDTFSIVGTVIDQGDAEKATQLITEAIKAHPEVKCIVGLYGYSGPAIAKAVDAAGRKGQIKIIGFDENPEEQALVKSGVIYASILQDQYRCGYETVRTLTDLMRGHQNWGYAGPRMLEMRVLILKADNMDEMRAQRAIRNVN